MLFKKKVPVGEYCTQNFVPLFSSERETAWEALRRACNDTALGAVEARAYYDHLRAAFIELMLIAVTKNCTLHASSAAHVFVMTYLERHNHSRIDQIRRGYSQAFASSGLAPNRDGVAEMVAHFADVVTSDRLQQATIERLYLEFYGMLKVFYDDFKSIKLVP